MEFEDHEEGEEEEIGVPVTTTYENSSRGARPDGSSRKLPSRYRECLKNHAVSIGGHAVDGCGEFMAAGEEGTLDGLKCAACNCHRNFHRKETDGENIGSASAAAAAAAYHHQFSPYYRTPAGYLHVAPHHRLATLALPSTSGGGGAHSREDQDDVSNPSSGGGANTKKRFRTKFTPEQKDKMLAFAERVGWRIQKHDEAAVQEFCTETCVKRHVLKVWMHNNKHTLGKKP
ncbi:zinc-finger homeodomain protein 1-like [Tasmannia lanceolata]|uniref:zinc-finger homeodomain protein 1-like n=1 Tax=Tasmannia lanceolata TaxID=3420 RepID=UPI0040634CBB